MLLFWINDIPAIVQHLENNYRYDTVDRHLEYTVADRSITNLFC